MNDDERKKLPRWAQERLAAQDKMGAMEGSAPIGFSFAVILVLVAELGLFVLGCVIIYFIGKAIVG